GGPFFRIVVLGLDLLLLLGDATAAVASCPLRAKSGQANALSRYVRLVPKADIGIAAKKHRYSITVWRGGHWDEKFLVRTQVRPTVPCNCLFQSHDSLCSGRGAAMTKLGIFVATIIAAAGAASRARAQTLPTTPSPPKAASAPKTCTGVW